MRTLGGDGEKSGQLVIDCLPAQWVSFALAAGSMSMQPFETIYVQDNVVACNGGGGPLGHPRSISILSAEGRVECPYCSRLFLRGELPHKGNPVRPIDLEQSHRGPGDLTP